MGEGKGLCLAVGGCQALARLMTPPAAKFMGFCPVGSGSLNKSDLQIQRDQHIPRCHNQSGERGCAAAPVWVSQWWCGAQDFPCAGHSRAPLPACGTPRAALSSHQRGCLAQHGCADRRLRARCHRDSERGEMRISCLSSAFLFISKCQHSALQVLIGRHLLLTAAELVKERMRMWRGRGLIESGCRDSSSGICSRQVQRNSEGEASRKDSCPSESPVLPNSWDGAGHGDFCTLTRSRKGPWG